ncbi:GTP pyrophosphokinase family protein [Metasolibacillus meyeri]|uniref:GTP pyrophosphokinase family protein n=1 Tax=Metasolibacillus meyeri TaxID=1071052 RepID=A0AAW9NHL4_9BACL|nr:GTP pyrophosphokinase family protein [Metasolibacillus meyeri]MEC1178159.1 GTP pyrophosphokinase family protein [Metasolibacillus meyeri]
MNTNIQLNKLKAMADELKKFMLIYKFGLDEMNTKIGILKEEFQMIHDYNPIEHTSSRLKSPESILGKIVRKNMEPSLPAIKESMRDIAGIRITCSFRSDIYRIKEMLCNQQDIELVECKDYIENPKKNGYQSLHLIVKVPVFMSDRVEKVYVEIQIRTIAMDFWASLEHKIYYKYDNAVPERLTVELKEAALAASELDRKMEGLHQEVRELKSHDEDKMMELHLEKNHFNIPRKLLEMVSNDMEKK